MKEEKKTFFFSKSKKCKTQVEQINVIQNVFSNQSMYLCLVVVTVYIGVYCHRICILNYFIIDNHTI